MQCLAYRADDTETSELVVRYVTSLNDWHIPFVVHRLNVHFRHGNCVGDGCDNAIVILSNKIDLDAV